MCSPHETPGVLLVSGLSGHDVVQTVALPPCSLPPGRLLPCRQGTAGLLLDVSHCNVTSHSVQTLQLYSLSPPLPWLGLPGLT